VQTVLQTTELPAIVPAPSSTESILPSSRLKADKGVIVLKNNRRMIPLFCANCHKDSGTYVLESNWDAVKNFAFYLCIPCAEKWSPLVDTMISPDEAFWKKVDDAQIDKFGRRLTEVELIEALKDESHIITMLARERENRL
jgi:hypothetical protein